MSNVGVNQDYRLHCPCRCLIIAPALETIQTQIDGGPGPPATLVREPGQIRKEAATADDVCAGMWLGPPPILSLKA